MLPSFAHGSALVRRLAQDGPRPTVLRLSDEAETAMGLARPLDIGGGRARATRRVPGDRRLGGRRTRRSSAAGAPPRSCCSAPAGSAVPGAGRRAGPPGATAARTCATRCWTPGALVETLETVTFWAALPGLYAAVSGALRDTLTRLGHPAGGPLPHLARVSGRGVAVLHRRLRPAGGSDRPVGGRQGGRRRGDPGRGRLDHPPPRRRRRPSRWLYPREVGRARRRGAARGQAHPGPGRDPQPRDPAGAARVAHAAAGADPE